MNTRRLLLSAILATLAVGGCSQPIDSPLPNDEPKTAEAREVKIASLSVAPVPHKPGEAKALPTTEPWKDRPSKTPWSELIVGKWVDTNRNYQGQTTWEFTRDGKLTSRYSYPAAPGRPKGIKTSTRDYSINGTVLFPTSSVEVGFRVRVSTTYIESLSDNELVVLTSSQFRWSREIAKDEAARRKVPLEQVLGEVLRVEHGRDVYVRLKDKDK